MSTDEKARPRREAKDGQEVESGISKMEAEGTILPTILAMLPRLRPVELKELATVINTRWLNQSAPAPVDHLAACWSSATPEDRAAFLETCHHAPAP